MDRSYLSLLVSNVVAHVLDGYTSPNRIDIRQVYPSRIDLLHFCKENIDEILIDVKSARINSFIGKVLSECVFDKRHVRGMKFLLKTLRQRFECFSFLTLSTH